MDNAGPALGAVVAAIAVALAIFGTTPFAVRPRGKDLAFVTSNAGERLLRYAMANGRFDAAGAGPPGFQSGRWLSGRVILTSQRLLFMPYAPSKGAQRATPPLIIALSAIPRVSDRFGLVTRVLEVETDAGVLTLRCFGGRAFAAAILAAQAEGAATA